MTASGPSSAPEPWLRGPVPRVPGLLQPAAHALLLAREDVGAALAGTSDEQAWLEPGGAAPLGYHLAHLAGSTDRLMTYARGAPLTEAQRATLERERSVTRVRPPLDALLAEWDRTVTAALEQLAVTAEATLLERRLVGRAQLPSTALGLLFHAAEHASRHTGQIVTTAKVVRGSVPEARLLDRDSIGVGGLAMRQRVSSGSAYEPKIGFSRAVRAGSFICVAGTAPIGPDGRTVGAADAAAQARRCFEIIGAALEQAGGSLRDVVRTRIFLTRIDDWPAVGAVHGEFFRDTRPASTMVQVTRLVDPAWLVEIEADAILDE